MAFIFNSPTFTTDSPLISSDIFFSGINTYLSPVTWSEPAPITVNLNYSRPLISTYETIDTNPDVRNKMINYYFDLIQDKWLMDDINDLLNYFKHKDGKVSMITNLSEYSKTNIAEDTNKTAEKKVDFIVEHVFDRDDLEKALNTFIKSTNTKFVELPKNEYFLKKYIKEYIENRITKKLNKKH
jgi:hypothetical protein